MGGRGEKGIYSLDFVSAFRKGRVRTKKGEIESIRKGDYLENLKIEIQPSSKDLLGRLWDRDREKTPTV